MSDGPSPFWAEVDEDDLDELRETGTLVFEFDGAVIEENPCFAIDYVEED